MNSIPTPISTDPMTPVRALIEAAGKATPGPWKHWYEGSGDFLIASEADTKHPEIGTAWSKDAHFMGLGPAADGNENNATFICTARNATASISQLLSEHDKVVELMNGLYEFYSQGQAEPIMQPDNFRVDALRQASKNIADRLAAILEGK